MADRFGYGSGSGSNPYREGQYATGKSGKIPAVDQNLVNVGANAAARVNALGAGDYSGIQTAASNVSNLLGNIKSNGLVGAGLNYAADALNIADNILFGRDSNIAETGVNNITNLYNAAKTGDLSNAAKNIAGVSNYSGSSGYSTSGYGYGGYSAGSGSAAATVENPMQWYIDMVNQTTEKNNTWAAEQAQKQMDFQERMSNTQHQREVADLKAAGLNPALSAGASGGAGNLSGAMAQPDTSNTRLLAEMSLGSLNSIGNSAVAMAASSNSKASNNFQNKLFGVANKYFIPAIARTAANALARGIFG